MNRKILAFGASNSRHSINRKFARYAAGQLPHAEINLIDLNDFELPIYSIDREKEQGIPDKALYFKSLIHTSNGILISFAEHNGAYTTAFKNIFDWASRIEKNVWGNKPMLLLATSPGRRGGKSVLQIAETRFRFVNQNTILTFSLPSFGENFDEERGIIPEELRNAFHSRLDAFNQALKESA